MDEKIKEALKRVLESPLLTQKREDEFSENLRLHDIEIIKKALKSKE